MSVNDYNAPVPVEGQKNVTVAGTPERLNATTIKCNAIVITARPGNTGKVAIGVDNSVRAAAGGEKGIILAPGQSVTMNTVDVMEVWADVTVGGEGVSYLTAVR